MPAGPYTEVIAAKLRLSNPSERRVCFKIKTNVPRQYCVQPSIALVLPSSHVDVTVLLQPVNDGCRPDVDCAHKFIVETILTPDNADVTSLERLVTSSSFVLLPVNPRSISRLKEVFIISIAGEYRYVMLWNELVLGAVMSQSNCKDI